MGIRISIVGTISPHRARDEILLFDRRKILKYEKDTDESRDIIYSAVMTAMSSRCVKDIFRIALNRLPGAFISQQDSPQVKDSAKKEESKRREEQEGGESVGRKGGVRGIERPGLRANF